MMMQQISSSDDTGAINWPLGFQVIIFYFSMFICWSLKEVEELEFGWSFF